MRRGRHCSAIGATGAPGATASPPGLDRGRGLQAQRGASASATTAAAATSIAPSARPRAARRGLTTTPVDAIQPPTVCHDRLRVRAGDDPCDDHRRRDHPGRARELAHALAIKLVNDERRRQDEELQAGRDLRQHEQRVHGALALQHDHDDRGHDREAAADEPPAPATARTPGSFHHDLPGRRAGDRCSTARPTAARPQQRRASGCRGIGSSEASAPRRARDFHVAAAMERRGRETRGSRRSRRAPRSARRPCPTRFMRQTSRPPSRRRDPPRGSAQRNIAGRGCAASPWRRGCHRDVQGLAGEGQPSPPPGTRANSDGVPVASRHERRGI